MTFTATYLSDRDFCVVDWNALGGDAAVPHAQEDVDSAILAASYAGENREGVGFEVASVNTTWISVRARIRFTVADTQSITCRTTEIALSPGLLCENNSIDMSALLCGYQRGAKLASFTGERD